MKHVFPPLVIPSPDLQPFIDTLVRAKCAAAVAGVCLVGTKAQVWSAYPRLPRSNRIIGNISQSVCESTSTPLLIVLNGAGAALFEPHKRPQRILSASAFDKFSANCSLGLSLEIVTELLKSEPLPLETLEGFVRRIICDAQRIGV